MTPDILARASRVQSRNVKGLQLRGAFRQSIKTGERSWAVAVAKEISQLVMADSPLPDGEAEAVFDKMVTDAFKCCICGRGRLCLSEKGYLGVVPKESQISDVILIIEGLSTAWILRPHSGATFRLVGNCYIHGIMDGELIRGEKPIVDIQIAWAILNPSVPSFLLMLVVFSPIWKKNNLSYMRT